MLKDQVLDPVKDQFMWAKSKPIEFQDRTLSHSDIPLIQGFSDRVTYV